MVPKTDKIYGTYTFIDPICSIYNRVELFDEDVLRNEFNLPDNIKPICLLPIGYKSDACPTSRNHGVRKDLTELVEYI